jgi:tRNA-specific 2-thiouridylase
VEQGGDGLWHLFCARDPEKDQSYFLHRLDQSQLAYLLFPLAELPKQEVKRYSKERGLPVVPRGESQDLCFVEEGRLPEFVAQRHPSVARRGEIRDPDGNVVGYHEGLHRFTVGQRGKLGIALGQRMYVRRLDRENNVVEVAPRQGVMETRCTLQDVHWIADVALAEPLRCRVRPRYRSRGGEATVRYSADGMATVEFDDPQFALTPGQAAVFYRQDEVLGGGWIDTVF